MSESPDARWRRIKDLVADAIELPPEARAARLAEACGGDRGLRQEVEALIQADAEAGVFLEHGVLDIPDAAAAIVQATQSAAAPGGLPSTRFGDYRLVRELGRGGMGVVYLAARDDERFEKLVAIKVMAGDSVDPAVAARFVEERRILASLDHPDIARLLDAGTSDAGAPYVVMEYVEGQPVDVYCAALPVRERLTLFGRVCDAVQYSHEHLIVHRDIKARNILVTPEGAPRLLDFGIAKLLDPEGGRQTTRTAFRALTPESASPEQVRGEPVTVATDVYSLGVLLYRLLTGRSPYRGDMATDSGVVRAICEEEPLRPSAMTELPHRRELRGDLDLIVLKALRKEPARRYSSVEQFGLDIRRHLDRRPIIAAPDAWTYRTGKFVARHWLALGAAGLVVVALAGGVIATARQAQVARLERARADRRFADVRRLANSFLFEFHDAIEPLPGSTKARELVVRRATEYLDSLLNESGHDSALERELAASYEKVGDVQGLPGSPNLGDTAGALRSHRSALALRQTLAAASPPDPALQRETAITHAHLSGILEQMQDFGGALEHARQSLAIREALHARNPSAAAERRSLANGYFYIGDILLSMGDRSAALDNFQRHASVLEVMLASDPTDRRAQREVGLAYKKLGGLLELNRERSAAIEKYRQAIALDEARVRSDRNDLEAQLDLSFGYASIGYALSTVPDVTGSLENYRRALELREHVASADANDAHAREAVGRAYFSIGQVLRSAGRRVEAIQHFLKAQSIVSSLQEADAKSGVKTERLANVYGALSGTAAELASAATNRVEAATHWRDARTWAQKALDVWSALPTTGPLPKSRQIAVDSLRSTIAQSNAALR